MENNNTNKSPVIGGYMNNTTHKTEERRFQEERRDVMKMDKLFAGLVAFVAGVALSAGSAFATKGYTVGDPAMMKLTPYYETGNNRATIIGIQNLSSQEAATAALHAAVDTAQAALDADDGENLQTTANLEGDLADAQEAVYTEHVFVAVNVYDAMGMMMDNASVTLCLAEGQFGYVVLQGPADMGADSYQSAVLSVMDGDIPEYGYAIVEAGSNKYTACSSSSPEGIAAVTRDDGTDDMVGDSAVAAWTIIQDVGDGFFGTEVPTSTLTMGASLGTDGTAGTDDDGDPEMTCYDGIATTDAPAGSSGEFQTDQCGLIPERHDNTRELKEGSLVPTAGKTTPRATVYARYDAGDESMVYVWLAAGEDTDKTHPRDSRTLEVTVKCEDGTAFDSTPDQYGDPVALEVAAPNKLTMIDPNGAELGDSTGMCTGDRGALAIKMPDGSHAGMVFSHVTQLMGHYRMNFPGYSVADDKGCVDPTDTDAGNCM